ISGVYAQGQSEDHKPDQAGNPSGDNRSDKSVHETLDFARAGSGGTTSTSLITYHKGPILLGTAGIYLIWYGNWSNNTATTILPDFASHLAGSPYYTINTPYFNASNVKVTNAVAFRGSPPVPY